MSQLESVMTRVTSVGLVLEFVLSRRDFPCYDRTVNAKQIFIHTFGQCKVKFITNFLFEVHVLQISLNDSISQHQLEASS